MKLKQRIARIALLVKDNDEAIKFDKALNDSIIFNELIFI